MSSCPVRAASEGFWTFASSGSFQSPPGFPQSHIRGQGGDCPGWALPTLLSLSLLDGNENVFTRPLVTGLLGGPQSGLQGEPWKAYAVSTFQPQAKCDLEDLG